MWTEPDGSGRTRPLRAEFCPAHKTLTETRQNRVPEPPEPVARRQAWLAEKGMAMTKAEERARVKALVVDRLEQAGMVRRRGTAAAARPPRRTRRRWRGSASSWATWARRT